LFYAFHTVLYTRNRSELQFCTSSQQRLKFLYEKTAYQTAFNRRELTHINQNKDTAQWEEWIGYGLNNTGCKFWWGEMIVFSSKCRNPVWHPTPPNLLVNGYSGCCPGDKLARGMGLTTHPHLGGEFKNEWRYASMPTVCSHSVYRDYFTSTMNFSFIFAFYYKKENAKWTVKMDKEREKLWVTCTKDDRKMTQGLIQWNKFC
jgi:hypothetical protein